VNNALSSALLLLLAIAGVAALLMRNGRALLRVGLNTAEASAVSGLAEVSVRRGDLTGLMERRSMQAGLRSARRKNLASAAMYALLLIVPPLLGVGREVYAACSLLWFLPTRPVRPSAALRVDERE
jgi:hypothetical protein